MKANGDHSQSLAHGDTLAAETEREHLSAAERDQARFMPLDGEAASEAAIALSSELAQELYDTLGAGKRGKPSRAFTDAVAALLSDHLRNADTDPNRWGFCQHGSTTFAGQRIGYRPFKQAFDAMVFLGLLSHFRGHQQHIELGGGKVTAWARAGRSRATLALLDRAAAQGITPANHDEHFALVPPPTPKRKVARSVEDPLELRLGSVRFGSVKAKGSSLPINMKDPVAAALLDSMRKLNDYLAGQMIEGLPHVGFRRIFNCGGPNYKWNKGGRLVSVGGQTYQTAKKAERSAMTINGEAVVELDITASHLTILHALAKRDFDPSKDPYTVGDLPRSVAKAWITATLGQGEFHTKWPPKARKDLQKKLGVNIQEAYPIAEVQERVTAALPLLAELPTLPWDWADLQYVESCAIVEAVERLAYDHDIPSLPVHDSIIVPASKEETASAILKDAFKKATGVYPHLKRTQETLGSA